ncbi:MAG: PorT family protein [Ignavibacteria bacterium]|jgi:hypothetical protein|nr:PorT family protein [Ignavibacteria bacterium]
MKVKLLPLFPCILVLFITGCTTLYVKNDFHSKEGFYKGVNENSGSAGLIMKNDSIISIDEPKIAEDSIKWETVSYRFAFDPNSMSIEKHAVPLNEVKAVTFTHHWGNNISMGVLAGMTIGGILTNYLLQWGGASNSGYHVNDPPDFLPGAVLGFLAGGIVGIIVGKDEVYILDESFTAGSMVNYNYRNKLGIKIARQSGFNFELKQQEGHNSGFTHLGGEGTPGFALTIYYNYPCTRQLSINGELSFISEGSEANYTILIPKLIHDDFSEVTFFSGQSKEKLSMLEAAPVARLNLWRSGFVPYIFLGPKFDLILNAQSGINNFLSNLKYQSNIIQVGLSSKYRRFVFGTTFGAGISTGNLLPVELLVEARYNYDLSPRLELHYDMPAGEKFFDNWYTRDPGNQKMLYRSSEFQINIGAAIF